MRVTMWLFATAACAASAVAAETLSVEWADEARSRQALAGDPVFQRTLACWSEGTGEVCELTVISILRDQCPALLGAASWRTDTGTLRVSRAANTMDIEAGGSGLGGGPHLLLHLVLDRRQSLAPMVQEASGVLVTAEDRVRSTELAALVRSTKGVDTREWTEVALKCSTIAVVAAKSQPK